MKEANYFAIEGVIGAGKTCLAELLSERLEGDLILENPETNPYLEDFYKNRKRYAFQVQLFFLLSRYRQLVEFQQQDLFRSCIVADYIFQKDKIFAYVNLEDRDYQLYKKIALMLEQELPKPDLVIYLQSSTERLIANIKKRGNRYEKTISKDYIKKLNDAYNEFFFRYTDTSLLVINSSEIDFVENEDDLEDLITQILNPPAGMKYYIPKKG
ncbi:deoxynucleoside kinase [bacterium]|nr:deoxynucleoside kinase [bacterium]